MVRRKSLARSSVSRSGQSSRTGVSNDKSAKKSEESPRKVKRRHKSGFRAMQEIKYLQKTTKLLIPKVAFARVVREIIFELFPRLDINRIQRTAMEALQEATEMYITQFMEDSQLLSFHAKRVTLFPGDMRLLRRLRGRDDVINR